MNGHDIIVVGASAGGIEPLKKLLADLPPDLKAAIFVVLHIPPERPSNLAHVLGLRSSIPVQPAEENCVFENSHAYVAVPDLHLILQKDRIRLVRSARENLSRPAIDPLFRSAAYYYGPRVIGLLLSGALDDGTAGLRAIKKRGGFTMVQDPNEAFQAGMLQSALNAVEVDSICKSADLAKMITKYVSTPAGKESRFPIPPLLEKETRIMENKVTNIIDEQTGKPSQFACPECGGVLWELDDNGHARFRCRVGHAYTVASMMEGQSQQLEDALWAALKSLEESISLYKRILEDARNRRHTILTHRFNEKIQTAEERAEAIRRVLLAGEKSEETVAEEVQIKPEEALP